MDKKTLKRYKKNKKEIKIIQMRLEALDLEMEELPSYASKVQSSSHDFPYIPQRVSVEIKPPDEVSRIKRKILESKTRMDDLNNECKEVEQYIAEKSGISKEVGELVYIYGMSQEKVGEKLGYTQARISQILKDL